MKRYLVIALVILAASCSVSRVDRYPGRAMDAFPQSLHGEYRLTSNGFKALFKAKQMDSIRIRISANKIETLEPKGWTTEFILSKEEVLSEDSSYLYLSRKDATDAHFWNTSVLRVISEKELVFLSLSTTDSRELAKDPLKNYLDLKLQVKQKGKEEVIQSIDPKDAAMLKILADIPASRKDSVLYYKMDEPQLRRFVEKELNNRDGLRFTRVAVPAVK